MKEIDFSKLTYNNFVTHPGIMLKDELKARKIKQVDFANHIGKQKSHLNEIIKAKRNINAEWAILIELSLGVSANFWINAQNNWDINVALSNMHNLYLKSINP